MDDFRDDGHRIASLVGFVFGSLLHMAVGVFVFSSGLIAPVWATVALIAVWFAAASLLWQWRRAPVRALLVPVVTAGIWWVAMTAGGAWLGWTA